MIRIPPRYLNIYSYIIKKCIIIFFNKFKIKSIIYLEYGKELDFEYYII